MSDSRRQFSSSYSFVPGREISSQSSSGHQRLPNITVIDEVKPSFGPVRGSAPRSCSPPALATPSDAKFTCRICLDIPEQPVVTVCGHLFCWNCLYRWIERNRAAAQCPVCRATIDLPDGHPERARVIPLYVDTSTEGKDPRASAPPRPQAERPEAPQPNRTRNFLNDMFGLDGGVGVGGVHNFNIGLGLFPGLFLNFNLGHSLLGVGGAGNQLNPERSRTAEFANRLLYSIAFFVMFIILMT